MAHNERHPCDDDAFTSNDEQIEELKHAVWQLVGDVEFLLALAEAAKIDTPRVREIRERFERLDNEDFLEDVE